MGKLGGRELNYASDVDVLFVHDGDTVRAEPIARSVLATMGSTSEDGIVFRTDADLRPEGRSGPLTRTLDSYASYYEGWGQTWEFQSLLKARPVAGDDELGARFLDLTRPYVWPKVLETEAVREIRAMKGRSEDLTERKGLADRELKRGRGGIRDIEFAVQLLQLVHGRHDENVRSATTLDALHALATGGYVEEPDAARLDDAYRFLRTVEHRLQLYDEQQTHTIPNDERARTRLARVLGYRDHGEQSALELFEEQHRAHQATVRSIHERLFFAPILDALAGTGPLSPEAAEERLAAFGFTDVARTRAAARELAYGLTRRSRLMQQLLPLILEWLSATPDPDLGLLQLRRLAEGPARSASLATTFRDAPVAARTHEHPARVEPDRRRRAAPSPRVRRRARPTTRRSPTSDSARSSSPTRSRRSSGAGPTTRAARACAGSSDGSSSGSPPATSSRSRPWRRPNANSPRSPRPASRPRSRASSRRCRSR